MASLVRFSGHPALYATGRNAGIANGDLAGSHFDAPCFLADALSLRGFAGGCVQFAETPDSGAFFNFVYWEDVVLDSDEDLHATFTCFFGDAAARTDRETLVTWQNDRSGEVKVAVVECSTSAYPHDGTATIKGTGAVTGAQDAGPCIVTSSTTGYFLYTTSGGALRIAKSTTLTSGVNSIAWSTKLVGTSLGFARGGLAKIGSTLYVIALTATGTYKVLSSVDDGTTWSTGATLPSAGSVGAGSRNVHAFPTVQFRDANTWVMGYRSTSTNHARLAITKDGGATWADVAVSSDDPSGVGVYVVHASHYLYQCTTGSGTPGGAGVPHFYETLDSGATWSAVPVDVGIPVPSASDYYYAQSKITHGPVASGGLDGGVPVVDAGYPFSYPGTFDLFSCATLAYGSLSFGSSDTYALVAGWEISEHNDPDAPGNDSETAAQGPSISTLATFADGFFEAGPSFSSLIEFPPTHAQGPSMCIETLIYYPTQEQQGVANIFGTTTRAQTGAANIVFRPIQTQAGAAHIIPATFTRTKLQTGVANIMEAPPPPPSVPINPRVARLPSGAWRFSWDAETPPYEIWLDGVLLATVAALTYDFALPGYEDVPPDLEILDAVNSLSPQNELYPPYVFLQWRGLQNASGYVVEQFVDAAWSVRAGPVKERKEGYYTWQSLGLVDETSYQFRVLAVDDNGNTGAPIGFDFRVCRNPTHPTVSIDLSSSGAIVVSEEA